MTIRLAYAIKLVMHKWLQNYTLHTYLSPWIVKSLHAE